MTERPKIKQLCVCDEEFCYCTEKVWARDVNPPEDVACKLCLDGQHVFSPDGRRAK